jgi:hypothetical protein
VAKEFDLVQAARDADGNADRLIRSMMLYARKYGHQSIYLTELLRTEDELIAAGILDPLATDQG